MTTTTETPAAMDETIAGDLRNSYVRGPTSPEHQMALIRARLNDWTDARIWGVLQPVLADARLAMLGKLRVQVELTGSHLVPYLVRECLAVGCKQSEIDAEIRAGVENHAMVRDEAQRNRPLTLVPYGQ